MRERRTFKETGIGRFDACDTALAGSEFLFTILTLRAMPVINLENPTLCLVGAPNVGKSSLVRVLSTGKPETNEIVHIVSDEHGSLNGTRLAGHIGKMKTGDVSVSMKIRLDTRGVCRFCGFHSEITDFNQEQGMASRSVLSLTDVLKSMVSSLIPSLTCSNCLTDTTIGNRYPWPTEETIWNNLEKLTLAVLSHLPTAILYVHDLSGECGTSPSDQFTIYKEVREKFTEHLWLDVVSKSDLLGKAPVLYATEDANPAQLELAKYLESGPDGAIHVSVKTNQGLHEMARINDTSKNQGK
ncbi:nucleolar GTP-binding protein 1 isoform X1 [Senna tora]|uniref:Nucleolar GTP-binding protein 1 isoform X1 n=1 Tax=Senna tora TaxID=362788 RepID=A0A834X741_9FABA|nr:nucleolar GTP-binding protein 1 isoform X1 [Senna tora]